MRRTDTIKLLLLLIIIFVSGVIYSQGFKHPGMLHTDEDFVRIKAQLAANEPAVVAGYNNLINNEWSQSTVGTWPVEIIKRGIASDENYINAARGAHAAYLNALRWKISGDVAHANRAVYILNSWASVTKALGGNTNVSLASGLYGYEFANAAELMRDYEGWNPTDFKKFQDWMKNVWYPYVYDFLSRRHDTWAQGTPGHYWSNWGLCNVLAMMSIGILCDDEFIYNQGVAYYKYDKVGTFKDGSALPNIDNWGLTEFIGNLVPVVHDDTRGVFGKIGQMQESGRDQGHATMALGMAVDICQTAWNQGDDLFGYMDNRLLAGIEYVAGYNTGIDDFPWTDYWYHDVRTSYENSWKQLGPNDGGRGQFRPYWDRILGHYEGVKGITLDFAHDMADKVVADAGAVGGTSGGYDHLGFSTLTCTRPAIAPEQGPLTLGASILYNGVTYQQGELNNVTSGSVITLIPLLPDTVVDTGNWIWNNDSTTKDLEIIADSSALYRVVYTNANGIESTQLFSISVYGDCLPDRYTYSVTTSNGVFNDTVVTVKQNSKVIMSVGSSSWHSTYLWNTGETSGNKEAFVVNSDTLFSVTGTNMGGAEVTLNFHINVEPLGHSYKVGSGDTIYRDKVVVVAGQTVTLMPVVKKGLESGTWLWSSGETSQNIVLDNIQEEGDVTVTYTHDGSDYPLTFSVIIVPSENSFAYWPMDENDGTIVHDVWAGNDGEMISYAWTGMGAKHGGVKLDGGESSYLKLSNDLLGTLNDFTISVWVMPEALDTWCRIWDFGTNTSYNMFLTPKSGDGYARFAIKAGGSEQLITTTETLTLNKWTHIAVTKSGNTAKMYINGALVGSNTAMTLNPSDLGYTENNYVGKSQWPDPMFIGSIDELKIYNSALSQAEVLNLIQDAEPYEHSYSLDGGAVVKDSIVPALTGQSVELMPVLKPGMDIITGLENITWLWDNSETTQNLLLDNIQGDQKVSVQYNHEGSDYTLTYSVIVKPDENAFAYWPMDETDGSIAHDIWCGNNGSINTCGWTTLGKYDGGIQFDGAATSYVMLPDNFISTLTDFTIAVWVKPVALDMWARIFDFGINTSYNMFLTTKAGDGYVRFAIKAGGSEQQVTTTSTLAINSWTHIAVTKSGNATTMYINGNIAGSNAAITLKPSDLGNTTQNYVGKSQWPDPMFKGTLDELYIYKNAMSQTEINDLITNGPQTGVPAIELNGSEMSIFPTVSASGQFTLKTDGIPALVTVYNLAGNVVKQFSTTAANTTFSLPKPQMYIVKVSTEKTTEVFKVIKK